MRIRKDDVIWFILGQFPLIILALLFLVIAVTSALCQTVNQDLLVELNSLRKTPLVYAQEKQEACDQWAKKISKSYAHASHGFTGETIGAFIAIEQIIPAFMESESHKKTLLDKRVSRVAIGIYVVPESIVTAIDGSVTRNPKTYYTVIRTYQ